MKNYFYPLHMPVGHITSPWVSCDSLGVVNCVHLAGVRLRPHLTMMWDVNANY